MQHNSNSDFIHKLKGTSLNEFQSLILSSRSDTQLVSLINKKLHLEPGFIEGALRRAVTARQVDLLKHALEINRLIPHDSLLKVNDEMILQQIQRAVNLHELDTLTCLLSFLSSDFRALNNKCHLQNLAILSVHMGFTDAVRLLCDKFPSCIEQTSQGHCLIITLARYSDQESIKLFQDFLSCGINVNMQEPSGDSALHVAVRERNMEAVKLLLQYKACTEMTNVYGQSPLTICDESDIMPLLKNADSPLPHSVSLYIAAENGDRETLQQILNDGVNIDSKWIKGRTALSAVAINGNIGIAEMLLDKGASTFPIGNTWPETPVAHALLNKHYNLAIMLLEKTEEMYMTMNDVEKKHIQTQLEHLLHNCAQIGAVTVAKHILDSRYGINANYAVLNMILPIHTACRYGHIDIVRLFLEYGVDPNACTQIYYNTPLHYACFYGNINIARLLLSLPGVEIDQENRQRETSLYCVLRGKLSAKEKGHVQESAVIFLIMSRAKLYKPGRNNCELALFDLQFAAQRWEFIPFNTQKLMIVVRDIVKPCSLSDIARLAIRSAIQIPINENVIDATGLSYRMQNYVLLKDWFPTL